MPGNYVHLDVAEILKETDKAFLLLLDDGEEIWCPFSQIADIDQYAVGDKNCTVSISKWLADQKGLG